MPLLYLTRLLGDERQVGSGDRLRNENEQLELLVFGIGYGRLGWVTTLTVSSS